MALTFNQLSSITFNKLLDKVIDNTFGSKAMLKRMMRPEYMKTKDGGIKIQGPIIKSTPGKTDRFYAGGATLQSNETDDMTAFTIDWKYQQEPIRIPRSQLLQNKGDAAKISLLASKGQIAQYNMVDVFGLGIFSDGTVNTGAESALQYTGIQAFMSETSTYGGLSVADVPDWKANVVDNNGVAIPLTLNRMQTAFGRASIDSMVPTVGVSKQNVYDVAWSLFQPTQRLINAEMKKLGFTSLEFNGIPLIVDSHMKAGSMYFLNENHVYFCAHVDENMRKEKFDQLENYNGILQRILNMGNLVCDQRRVQSELADILVAA